MGRSDSTGWDPYNNRNAALQATRADVQHMTVEEIQALVQELQVHLLELQIQNEELRNTQLELEVTRDRYRQLYDFAPVGYLTLDQKGVVLEANLAAANLMGADRRDLIQARFPCFIASDFQDAWYRYLQGFCATRARATCELCLVRSDGVRVFVQVDGVPTRGEELEDWRIGVCLADISRRKQLQEKLQALNAALDRRVDERTEELTQALEAVQRDQAWLCGLVETTQDAVVSVDRERCIVLFNRAAERTFGYDKTEVEGRRVNMLMAEPHASQHDGYIERYERTREPRAIGQIRTVEGRRKNGETFPAELSVTEIRMDHEIHYAAFIRDVSEQRRLQAQLIENERLAAVGSTAAGVAHEIANPLNGMSMTIQLIERRITGLDDTMGQEVKRKLQTVKREIQRLSGLLGNFTALARKQEYDLEPHCLEPLCRSVLEMEQQRFADAGIHVEQSFPGNLKEPVIEENAFKQALINLFKNAAEAMPEGGLLSVRAWNEPQQVVLEVRDTGKGVPEGIDIFAPFTSTKRGGTGLGMTITRKIIRDLGGTITYDSEPGRHTVFRMRLPIKQTE